MRRSIDTLAPADLDAFKAGVEVMKARPASNPTSWIYQAEMHAMVGDRCQHNTFFFVSWHRMYIYWFERILRQAAKERFPDAEVTLPYWNYGDAAQRALPAPFRTPADPVANPLYVVERGQGVNAGATSSDPSIYNHGPAFARANFLHNVSGEVSFGGMAVTAPSHQGPIGKSGRGLLENMPHGGIHNWVGGRAPSGAAGFMSTLRYAPRDPIFWLHHANLDRLWKRWLDQGGGRANPDTNADWMNDRFHFFDEFGAPVEMSAAEVLDTAGQLGYAYDDDPAPAAARAGGTTRRGRRAGSAGGDGRSREATTVLGVGEGGGRPIVVGPQRAVVPLTLSGPIPKPAALRHRTRLVLALEGLRGAGLASGAVGVYLNLPTDGRPLQQTPTFLGTVSLFGIQPWDAEVSGHAGHAGQPPEALQSFDITDNVRDLQGRSGWRGRLSVTLVPVDLASATPPTVPVASVGRLVLRTTPAS